MKILFFLSRELFVYSFFFMNIEKNNSEYIFLLIITCLNFLLDYDQLFFSIIYKKCILIKNGRLRVMKKKLLTKTR